MDLRDLNLEIYLIRHADPAGKLNHWSSPTTPLSKQGLNQAEKIAHYFRNHKFDAILTSPFTRAKQTAEVIVRRHKSVQLQEQSWLSEINLGEWTGRHKDEITHQLPDTLKGVLEEGYDKRGPLVANLLMLDRKFSFPLGESLQVFWNRVMIGLQQILDQFKGKEDQKIGLIGHGGSFTIIILSLLGRTFFDNSFPIFMFKKADYTILRIKNRQVYFLQMNPLF